MGSTRLVQVKAQFLAAPFRIDIFIPANNEENAIITIFLLPGYQAVPKTE